MNTLQDLRSTLDLHAADVTDTSTAERVASVAGRARVVRRRRAAGVAAAAVLAVGAASAIATIPGDGDLLPAEAPASMTSLGWTYDHADTFRSDDGELATELLPSDLPRLVSWATTGDDQDVVVRIGDVETWGSDAGDYDDFVWVPPGYGGEVTVSGSRGLELATYELDDSRIPEGVGEGIQTLRADVAGYDQLGAAAGEPGQASFEVPIAGGIGDLQLAYTCEGLPRGYDVRIGFVGETAPFISGNGCTWGSGFDPAGSINAAVPRRAGETLRIWVTSKGQSVADGELPDLRLSLAVYEFEEEPLTLAGHPFQRRLEHGGKVFEVVDSIETGPGELPRLSVREDGDHVIASWLVASPQVPYALSIGGVTDEQFRMSGMSGSGPNPLLLRPVADEVSLVVGDIYVEDVTKAALVLYRRVE